MSDQVGHGAQIGELLVEVLKAFPWPEPTLGEPDDEGAKTLVERKWLPTIELEDLCEDRVVHVVPRLVKFTPASDDSDWVDVTVEVGLMRKPQPVDDETKLDLEAEADEQEGLVTRLADHFRGGGRLLGGLGGPAVTSVEVSTLMLDDHLYELQQLTSVLRLVVRDRR